MIASANRPVLKVWTLDRSMPESLDVCSKCSLIVPGAEVQF